MNFKDFIGEDSFLVLPEACEHLIDGCRRYLNRYRRSWDLILNNDKKVIYCSPNCEMITGYPANKFLQRRMLIKDIVHPEDQGLCSGHLETASNDDACRVAEFRIITLKGEVKKVACYLKPIRCKNNYQVGTLISHVDITPYWEKSALLKKENSRLIEKYEALHRELSEVNGGVNQNENELFNRNKALEKTNQELFEANDALKVLARNIDAVRRNTEERMINLIYKDVYPLMNDLKRSGVKPKRKKNIENILFRLEELCRGLGDGKNPSINLKLSPTEVQVAILIRDGLLTNEIAQTLNISASTVNTHRKNIRRKFKLQNSKINLASYLKMKWHERA